MQTARRVLVLASIGAVCGFLIVFTLMGGWNTSQPDRDPLIPLVVGGFGALFGAFVVGVHGLDEPTRRRPGPG